jgi:hypothetical protein
MTDFPDFTPARAPWLMTFADLALLLVGFLLLVQVTGDKGALAKSLREGFGAAPAPAMPVLAIATGEFAAGSAALGAEPELVAWSRDALRDPRVTLAITGAVDGTVADVDPSTGSGTVLAADRARTVAALLGRAVPAGRLTITTAVVPGRRAATVALAFGGEIRRR